MPEILGGVGASLCVSAAAVRFVTFGLDRGSFTGVPLDLFPEVLALCTLGMGLWLIGLGWPRTVGSAITCRSCGYKLLEPPDRLISACPECSNSWRWFGRSRRGERVVRPGALVGGALSVLLALAGSMYRHEMIGAATRAMSTPTLVRIAMSAPGVSASNAWYELASRTLTPGETAALTQNMLDARRQRGGLNFAMEEWLDAQVSAASAGPEVRRQYLSEMLTLRLELPDDATVGEDVPVAIRGVLRHQSGELSGGTLNYTISGYSWMAVQPADGMSVTSWPDASVLQRPGRPATGRLATNFRQHSLDQQIGLIFHEPGTYRVSTKAWVYVDPVGESVVWGDHVPFWGGGVEVIQEVELSREITVRTRQ